MCCLLVCLLACLFVVREGRSGDMADSDARLTFPSCRTSDLDKVSGLDRSVTLRVRVKVKVW